MNRRAAIYFAVVTAIFFLPLLWGDAFLPVGFLYRTPLWYNPTVPLLQFDIFDAIIATYPYQTYLKQGLMSGEIPLWNPYNFGGHPIAFNGQSGYFYPPRIILLTLFPVWLAHGLSLALHLFVAGFGAWLLGRRLGQSPVAAAIFGTAWMFNPFILGWLEIDILNICAAWTPLALLAVERCRRDWRGAGYLGLCMGLLLLSGHLQFILYTITTVILVGLLLLKKMGCPKIVWPRLGVAAVIGSCLCAPMLIPSAFFLSTSQRPKLSAEHLINMHQQFLKTCSPTTIFPNAWGNGNDFAIQRIFSAGEFIQAELCLYFGIVPLLLAIAAIRIKGLGRWSMMLALFVLIVPSTPLFDLFHLLPGLNKVNSTRSIQIIHFLVALSAGFGYDALDQQKVRKFATICGSSLLLVALMLANWATRLSVEQATAILAKQNALRLPARDLFVQASDYQQAVLSGFDRTYDWANPAVWLPLLCLLLGLILITRKNSPKYLLLFLVALDLMVYGKSLTPHHASSLLYPHNPSVQKIREAGIERVMGIGSIKPNTLKPLLVADLAGYDSFYPKDTSQYLAYLMRGEHRPDQQLPAQVFPIKRYQTPLVDLFGVKYFVAYPGQRLAGKKLLLEQPLPIFENPDRFPRAFLVSDYKVEMDNGKVLASIDKGLIDPRKTVFVDREASDMEPLEGPGQAQIRFYSANEVQVHTESPVRKLLVLTDAYAQGWEARVDGIQTKILRANVMFRAVSVPAGKHEVTFHFKPPGYRVGLILALLALIGSIILIVRSKPNPEGCILE